MEKHLIFIHGFLGHPQDWQQIRSELSKIKSFALDLNKDFSLPELNFKNWPQAFRRWLKDQKISSAPVVVGYSMGGRLALPLLHEGLVKKAFVVSSHLGLPAEASAARAERRQQSEVWAQKFLSLPWPELMRSWNQQDVFSGSQSEPLRLENDFNRDILAALLRGFSLSEQGDFHFLLQKNSQLHWAVGELDTKYKNLALRGKDFFSAARISFIPQAGHRALWEQPQKIAELIRLFI